MSTNETKCPDCNGTGWVSMGEAGGLRQCYRCQMQSGNLTGVPTPPAGAEPSPEAKACANEITNFIPLSSFDPFYIEAKKKATRENALIITRHFAPLRAELAELTAENEKLCQANKVYERDEPKLRHDLTTSRARIGELEKERDEDYRGRQRMHQLLDGVADAIRGEAKPLTVHDWSRLPKEAGELKAALALANAKAEEARRWKDELQGWGGTPQIVDQFIKGQQMRIWAVQDVEKDLTAALLRAEHERSFREWCYVTVGTDNLDCLKTLLENGMKDRATIEELRKENEAFRMAAKACEDCMTTEPSYTALKAQLALANAKAEEDRATIAELKQLHENQAGIIRSSVMPASKRECLMLDELDQLRKQLAIAKGCYESQRSAGVKCFDQSHPDDLQARIHATVQQHERISGRYIYLASYLEKAIFELLTQ